MYKLSEKSIKKLSGVRPEIVALAVAGIKDSPYDYGISHGVRTIAEQRELYAKGRTTAGKKVTWTMNSKHLIQDDGFGHAFDFIVYVNGKLTWEEKYYDAVGEHLVLKAAELGVSTLWGGHFKTRKDRPHFQYMG